MYIRPKSFQSLGVPHSAATYCTAYRAVFSAVFRVWRFFVKIGKSFKNSFFLKNFLAGLFLEFHLNLRLLGIVNYYTTRLAYQAFVNYCIVGLMYRVVLFLVWLD